MHFVEKVKNKVVYLYDNYTFSGKAEKTGKSVSVAVWHWSKSRGKFIIVFLLFSISQKAAFTQSMGEDNTLLDSIKTGIHYTYNYDFEKAESILSFVKEKYPNQPACLMFEAIILYWKYYPLLTETEMGNKYESLILKSLSLSQIQLQKMPNHQLTNFFAMMPRMMLVQYYNDNGSGMKSIPHLSTGYKSVVKGFDYCQTTPEYYFTTGLYNYYIEAYPERNPFYKPFVFFFPSGNKVEGLHELYTCWQQSEIVGPEALTFLSYIYINFESNYAQGLKYALELTQKYPKNPFFVQNYIQLLLLNKQYGKADTLIVQFQKNNSFSSFFKNTFLVYDAIVKEHYYANDAKAEEMYNKVIASMNPFGNFANRYIAYAYFGLSRINKRKGLLEASQFDTSKAKKYAQYPQVNFN
jgi:hypothetical protein